MSFFLPGDVCGLEKGIDVSLIILVGGHLVPFAAFIVQAQPFPAALGEVIIDLHRLTNAPRSLAVWAPPRPILMSRESRRRIIISSRLP